MENREESIRKNRYLGILLGMCLLFPALLLLGECFGFRVIVRAWGVHGVVFTLLFSVVSIRVLHSEAKSQTGSILACLLFPASTLHTLTWTIGRERFWLAAFLSLVWIAFSVVIMIRNVKSLGAKFAASMPSALILLPTFLVMLFLPFVLGYRTAVQTVTSVDRNYRADVVEVNEGALGGDTIVEVCDLRKQFDSMVFLFQKKPQIVYWGDWGEFQTMKLEWKSEQVLLINGVPHEIN